MPRERCDPLSFRNRFRHSPAKREAGRVGCAEFSSIPPPLFSSFRGHARHTRPVNGRYSRVGEPGVFGSAARPFGRPAALAPYDHEPVQRVRACRKTPDPAVSCPAGNASAVRFALGRGALPSLRRLRTFSTSPFPRIKSGVRRGRSDACRAGRRSDIQRFGALRIPPCQNGVSVPALRWRRRDLFWRERNQTVSARMAWIDSCPRLPW
jgi:hypothetical protein